MPSSSSEAGRPPFFRLEGRDGEARAGTIATRRGEAATPAFMPVATQGTVKAVTHEEVEALGYPLLMVNTYHMAMRPGIEAILRAGGLHAFIGWPGAIATDSGGFQVMSLSDRCRISDEGAVFRAPLDGREHVFTPESVIGLQEGFGSELGMVLDECPPHAVPRETLARAVTRTGLWARRSQAARKSGIEALFGIVQGGTDEKLRERSAREITSLGFDGYAVGGLSVGESKKEMGDTIRFTAALLPREKVRYLMGVGEPGDVLRAVRDGVDLFDCVFPTRVARNGLALTSAGRFPVRNAPAALRDGPLEEGCLCPACRRYGVSYLRHLIHAHEITGMRLLTLHNLAFMRSLLAKAREAILAGRYEAFCEEALRQWPAD